MRNWLLATMTAIAAVFQPASSMFATVLVLITADLVLGILAARKRGEKINSSGIGRTIVKLLVYEVAIALAFLTETYLTGSMIPCSKVVASLVGTAELLSVMENLNSLSGGDLLKTIIDKLNSLGKQ